MAIRVSSWAFSLLLCLTLIVLALGLGVGSTGWQAPWGLDAGQQSVLWDIRAPRTVGSFLVGALLGLSGAVAQGLFRNPLAEPYLLGSSSGAALGLSLALAWGASSPVGQAWFLHLGMTGVAFVGAVAGVWLTLLLSGGARQTMRLLLCGVVVGVVLGAITQLLMVWSAEIWRTMQTFMLGNTSLLDWQACVAMSCVLLICLPAASLLSRVLDALSLGEDAARGLGVSIAWARFWLVAILALCAASAVGQAGLVAFVGLVAPHLVRPWSGALHRRLLWASAWMGGVLLTLADVLSRWLLAPQELPVGVLTAVLGGVYLLSLIYKQGRR